MGRDVGARGGHHVDHLFDPRDRGHLHVTLFVGVGVSWIVVKPELVIGLLHGLNLDAEVGGAALHRGFESGREPVVVHFHGFEDLPEASDDTEGRGSQQ